MFPNVSAAGSDIAAQIVTNAATGSDYDVDATFSAALMPKRHFLSAVFGDGLDIDLMPEGGRSISFDPGKAMIGGAFGQLGQVDVGTGALFKMLKTGPAAKFIYGDFVPGLFFGSMKEIAVEGVSDN